MSIKARFPRSFADIFIGKFSLRAVTRERRGEGEIIPSERIVSIYLFRKHVYRVKKFRLDSSKACVSRDVAFLFFREAWPAFPRERRKPQTPPVASLINRPFLLPLCLSRSPFAPRRNSRLGARCLFGVLVIRVSSSTLFLLWRRSPPPLPPPFVRLLFRAWCEKREKGESSASVCASTNVWKQPRERRSRGKEKERKKRDEQRGSRPRPRSRRLF